MGRTVTFLLCAVLLAAAMSSASPEGGRTADGDNGFDTAAQLAGNPGFVSGSLDTSDDPADYYKLEARSGDIINASLFINEYVPSDPKAVDFNLGLFNPSRALLGWSNSTYRYDSLNELALVTGTYYLVVTAFKGKGGYVLDFSSGPPNIVQNGMTINGYLTNSSNHNSDWYRVQLRGGASADRLTATIHEDATANFDLYIMDLWSGYSFWYDLSWSHDPDEKAEAVATYSGYYYIKVYDYLGFGKYVLDITVQPGTGHSETEPSGARVVPYNSTVTGQVDMATRHYNWYKAEVAQDEIMTASLRLDPQPTDMFSLSILAADMSTLDSRTNFVPGTGGGAPSLARVLTLTKAAPAAGTYYFVVMAKIGLMPNLVDALDANAASDYALTVNLSAHLPPPTNNPPTALVPGVTVEVDENSFYEVDLTALFRDTDGDQLHYTAPGMAHTTVEFNMTALKVVLTPAHNWYGIENITITAADPYDANATAWVLLKVRPIPLGPEILERAPSNDTPEAVNGSTLTFRVFATDPNGAPLLYSWAANGFPLAARGNSTDWKATSDLGVVTISVTISNSNFTSSATWRVSCVPRPPLKVVILSPVNRTAVKEGAKLRFFAMVSGLPASDMANLTYAWYTGGTKLSDAAEFVTTSFPPGDHEVEVRVMNRSEPAWKGRAVVSVTVEKKEAAADYTMQFLLGGTILAAAVAGGALFVASSRRRKRPGDEDGEDEDEDDQNEKEEKRKDRGRDKDEAGRRMGKRERRRRKRARELGRGR